MVPKNTISCTMLSTGYTGLSPDIIVHK